MALQIILNGEQRAVDPATSVRTLLEGLGLDPAKIAVERNLAIVPRSTYADVALADGDRLEIVHFIGGGNAPVEVPRPQVDAEHPLQKQDRPFVVAGRSFKSRLIIGTGKYK